MAMCLSVTVVRSQTYWETTGNVSMDPVTNFIGTTDNQPMNVRTDDDWRLRVNKTQNYVVNSSFGAKTANGWMLLSPDIANFLSGANGPYSLLHLAAATNNAQTSSDRPWMNVGMTLTGNSDHSYVGQKSYGTDKTDMVIHWSDNPATWYGPDRLRFLFTSGYSSSSSSGAYSEEGLEGMRLYPVTPDEVNVGIGDFYAANLADPTITEPEERLDVVDGKVRVRQLPTDPVSTSDEMVTLNMSTGVLEHRPIVNLPDNCEWQMSPGVQHVWTAVGPADPDCPDEDEFVGIGTNAPSAKLDVRYAPASGTGMTTIRGEAGGGADSKIGGGFYTDGTGLEHYGVQARSYNGTDVNTGGRFWGELINTGSYDLNVGAEGLTNVTSGSTVTNNISLRASCSVGGTTTNNFGVHSQIWNSGSSVTDNYGGYFDAWTSSNAANNYGLYTMASGGSTAWALFVNGTQFSTSSNIFSTSDPSLKTNVQPADRQQALDLLNAIPLYTYEFDPSTCPQMNMPTGTQLGVMAPELQAVLPELVRDVHQPASYDQSGNLLHPGRDLKAVSYTGLIPYLMAAFQQQQQTISTLEDQLAAMQQDLATCCSAQGGTLQRELIPGAGAGGGAGASEALRTDLHIIPNPVADLTQLRYTVATPGRTRLEVSDSNGKRLEVLEEAVREVGTYTHEWTTTDLAPGTYHCTLYLNDSFVVKKAVKVAR